MTMEELPSPRKTSQTLRNSQIEAGLFTENADFQDQNEGKCLNLENKSSGITLDGNELNDPVPLLPGPGSPTAGEIKPTSRASVNTASTVSGLPTSKGFTRRQPVDESYNKGSAVLQEPLNSFGKKMNVAEKKDVMKGEFRSQNRMTDMQNNNSSARDNLGMTFDENKNSRQSDADLRDRPSSSKADDCLIPIMNNGFRKESSLAGIKTVAPKSDVGSSAASSTRSLKTSKLATPSSVRARSVTDARSGRPSQIEAVRSSSACGKNSGGGNSLRPASGKEYGLSSAKTLEQPHLPSSLRRGKSADPNSGADALDAVSSEQMISKTMSAKTCGLRPPKVIHTVSHNGTSEAFQNDSENGSRNQSGSLLSYKPPSYKASSGKDASNESADSEKIQHGNARGTNSSTSQKSSQRQLPDPLQSKKGTLKLSIGDGCQSETASLLSVASDCNSAAPAIGSSGRSKLRPTNLVVKTPVSPPPVPVRCQSLNSENCSVRSVSSIPAVRNVKQPQLETSQDANKNRKTSKKEGNYENATYAELEMNCTVQAGSQSVSRKNSGCSVTGESLRALISSGHCVGSSSASVPSSTHHGFSVSALSPGYTSSSTDKHYSNLTATDPAKWDTQHSFMADPGCYAKNCGYLSDTASSEVLTGYLLRRGNSINDSMSDNFAIPNSSRCLYKSFHGSGKNTGEQRSINKQETATYAISQTPKLSSRSKMISPSVYSQGAGRGFLKSPQVSGNKENWQRYCIPSSNSTQLPQMESGKIERATLPKIGKCAREMGSSALQHQISDSGGYPLRKIDMQESCLKPYMKDKLVKKDSFNADLGGQSFQVSKVSASDLSNSMKSGMSAAGSAMKKETSGSQNISTFSLKEEKLQMASAADKSKSFAKGQLLSADAASLIGHGAGHQAMGLLYSPYSNANIRPQHFSERNSCEKYSSSGDRRLHLSNHSGSNSDATSRASCPVTSGSGINCLPLTLTNCYQHPYSGSRCTTPRHSGISGSADSSSSCLLPVCESKEIDSSTEFTPSVSLSAKVGSMSGRLGYTRPSSPKLLSSRDEDVHGSLLSLISNVSSVYSVAEEKQTQEIYKLKRELEMAHEKISTLTTQLSTNSHVVAAFEQSLANMTRRLQRLMTTSEQKDAELNELKSTMQQLQTSSSSKLGVDLFRRQSSTMLSSPVFDRGDGSSTNAADLMSSFTSLSSNGNSLSETTASLDKKQKKKGWLKSSITKAFSRKKSKSWIDSENSPIVLPLDLSAQNSPFPPGTSLSTSIDSGTGSSSNHDTVQIGDCVESIGMDSVLKLQQQLHEKDLKLTDIQLEALSSAHQLEQLKETMTRMKSQIISLKSENERMQKIMESKGQVSADLEKEESPQRCKLNLGGPTNFDSIAMDSANKDGGKFFIAVQVGKTAENSQRNEIATPGRVLIGTIEVGNHTNWEMLDSNIRLVFKEYLSRLEPGTSMGLSGSSIVHYRIGEIRRLKGHGAPELLPCGYLVGDNKTINILLKGLNENSIDSLVFETLVPKSILQRYISLLMEHRRMILCGPSGTGKTYLAQKLAEYLVQVSRKERSPNAVATFNVDHKSSKELRQYLSNIADQCENATNDLPTVIILDNLQHVGSLGEAFNAFLGVDIQLCPYIIGTMTQTGSNVGSLQLHHNFRWVLCPSHLEPVRGFLGRFLQRRLIEEEVINGIKNPELTRISAWLPKVWQHLNKFLETYSSSDVTIGPRLFLTCPMDSVTSQTWFGDLWNYSIIPYLLEAVREGVQVYGHKAKWENPTEWVIQNSPWTEKMQRREWPSLLHLRPEDVGYDTHIAASSASASPVTSRSSHSNEASSNNGPDPLLTLVMRLQEAASLSGVVSNENSDTASLDSHNSEIESQNSEMGSLNSTMDGQDMTSDLVKTQSRHADRIESMI